MTTSSEFDYDVLVIGSGFGGSVSALRLSEKGYRVGVLEAGRRWAPSDFPKTSWHLRDFLWAPKLGLTGPQQLTPLKNTFILSAAGVGGGSLIYGNTLYEPEDLFFTDPQWAQITDWRSELAPYYDQAKRMLGVTANPRMTAADEAMRQVAEDLGTADTFRATDVGVFFGEPGVRVGDPFFGGAGPDRAGCIFCAQCLTGCPHNAKNTTETNYLYLAERAGAHIHPMTTVTDVRPRPGGGYDISTVRSGRWIRKDTKTFTAEQVIFSAAALGTQKLLHKLKDSGSLPEVSPRLGELTRTNSEAILHAKSKRRTEFAEGIAITSSIHATPQTHVEACHYGKGSNAMHLMTVPLMDGERHRLLRFLLSCLAHPLVLLHSLWVRRASEKTISLLVMQAADNSLTTYRKRGLFGTRLSSKQGRGEPNPVWIPDGNDVARRVAEKIGGYPEGSVADLVNIPMTGHFIGGATIGEDAEHGVIDPYQRLYGYAGLHVVDGSAITANLGVNPSLTITAQSERAMAFWPNKGEPDPRPALGSPYRRIKPVQPKMPVVPTSAVGALRLPLVDIS